jgi:PhnB protein
VTPYLIVKDLPKALDFYKKAFGAQETFRFESSEGKCMHAEIQIGNSRVMISSECREKGWLSPATLQGNSSELYLYVPNVDAAFDQAVKAGCKVMMSVADRFWGDRVCEVLDPSGHRWSLATHVEDLTPDEINRRGEVYFSSLTRTAGTK